MAQQVRFCTAADGVGLAYAVHGQGPPIVRAATWLTHLDFDWESPVWRHWLAELGSAHTLVRYDERGCGLSDHELGELGVDTWVGDLETVVDAAGVDRFALLGVSQGAAVALVYAARHPERVSRLILYGGYARGRTWRGHEAAAHAEAMASAIRAGWTDANPTFRHLFSMLYLPSGTPEQMAWYDELQRRSTSAEIAVRLYEARNAINVVDVASRVTTPTLVAHARGDSVVPVEEGRLLAARIPGARFVPTIWPPTATRPSRASNSWPPRCCGRRPSSTSGRACSRTPAMPAGPTCPRASRPSAGSCAPARSARSAIPTGTRRCAGTWSSPPR